MRLLVTILVFTLYALSCHSQEPNNVKSQINAIKLQDDKYIYAEAVHSDKNTAYQNAQALLEVNIEEWAKNNKMSDVKGLITTCSDHILKLETMRGRQFLAFVYVEKDKILPYKEEKTLVVVPISENKNQDNNTPVSAASADGTVEVSLPAGKTESVITKPVLTLTNIEKEMLLVSSITGIKNFVTSKYKDKGNDFVYDTHKNMPSDVYMDMFIYDRNGEVKAYLRRDNNKFINLKTNDEDNLANYKGYALIWFRQK